MTEIKLYVSYIAVTIFFPISSTSTIIDVQYDAEIIYKSKMGIPHVLI